MQDQLHAVTYDVCSVTGMCVMCLYSPLLLQSLSECEDSNYAESPDHMSGDFKGTESLLLSVSDNI